MPRVRKVDPASPDPDKDSQLSRRAFGLPPTEELTITDINLNPHPPGTIGYVLDDPSISSEIESYANAGFTISTIAARINISERTFRKWVLQGKEDHALEQPTLHARLWSLLSKGWATARGLAESRVAEMDPKWFLTRGPSKLLGEDWTDTTEKEEQQQLRLEVGTEMVQALKILRNQGIDLNEIIDKDMLTLNTSINEKDESTKKVSEEIKTLGLPGQLSDIADNLEQHLNLTYGK